MKAQGGRFYEAVPRFWFWFWNFGGEAPTVPTTDKTIWGPRPLLARGWLVDWPGIAGSSRPHENLLPFFWPQKIIGSTASPAAASGQRPGGARAHHGAHRELLDLNLNHWFAYIYPSPPSPPKQATGRIKTPAEFFGDSKMTELNWCANNSGVHPRAPGIGHLRPCLISGIAITELNWFADSIGPALLGAGGLRACTQARDASRFVR